MDPMQHPIRSTWPSVLGSLSLFALLGLLGLFALAGPVSAIVPPTETSIEREKFLAAEKALELGRKKQFRKLKSELKGYPLYPYLDYSEIKKDLRRFPKKRVKAFLDQYPETPLAKRLQVTWLKRLARYGRWKTYISFYQDNGSIERRCDYLHALIQTGEQELALAEATDIWIHSHSRPKSCDPVFKVWKADGRMTTERIWKRIALAMSAGQTQLARYLSRSLEEQEKPWFDVWNRINRHPEKVLKEALLKGEHPYKEQILLHAVKRIARKDAQDALDLWHRILKKFSFSSFYQHLAERRLALSLVRTNEPSAYQLLKTIAPCDHDTRLLIARLKTALFHQDWPQLITWTEQLPDEIRQQENWRYWLAFSLGETGDQEAADALYQSLAKERSYYGFLAADQIGADYHLPHKETPVDETLFRSIKSHPAILRVRELLALDRVVDARREWNYSIQNLNKMGLMAAAKLAESWDWHDQAIFTLARSDYWDDLTLRFPIIHTDEINSSAERHQLDNSWILAIIRQESAFVPDARSHAGARGLMQLMPATARGVSRYKRPDLTDPETNIELGSKYFRQKLNQFDANPVLAIASYNAGPHRVLSWLPDKVSIPAEVWVELVPYRETRSYLRRVLAYKIIYEKRLGQKPGRLSDHLKMIPPKT